MTDDGTTGGPAATGPPMANTASLPTHGTEELGVGAIALTPRIFWRIFAGGWFVFWAMYSSVGLMTGSGLGMAMAMAFGNTLAPGVPAWVLARQRRTFLQPRGSVRRFIAHKAWVGLGFAVATAVLGSSYYGLTPIEHPAEFPQGFWAGVTLWLFDGLFLYTLFVGFLMWADSLDRMQESRAFAARQAVLRAQAEAKALRAQFSPHFVFNTLHSLMLLVRADPSTAEQAIEDVAELIRYASTLQRQQIDRVTLSKEIEFARRFIALEKLRLEDRLSVEWEIEDGLSDVFVPAFSLQTLLENSIKHGIAPKPSGGSILIRATSSGGVLELLVEDDGVGADPAQVGANGGSGLHLLEGRLAHIYHGDASLAWKTRVDGGFGATVRVPLQRVEDEAGDE